MHLFSIKIAILYVLGKMFYIIYNVITFISGSYSFSRKSIHVFRCYKCANNHLIQGSEFTLFLYSCVLLDIYLNELQNDVFSTCQVLFYELSIHQWKRRNKKPIVLNELRSMEEMQSKKRNIYIFLIYIYYISDRDKKSPESVYEETRGVSCLLEQLTF